MRPLAYIKPQPDSKSSPRTCPGVRIWPFRPRNTWYAQHGEDRTLAGLLSRRRRGFYIDVGAWDPVQDSVTKHFYDRGWRGINVEPHPEVFARLSAARPRDINLQVALGEAPGARDFVMIGRTGLSTFEAPFAESAVKWVRENREQPAEVTTERVAVATLADVCRRWVPPGMPIDFLKVDVEGSEERVLRGGDWATYRPHILVVEAVEPLSDTPSWQSWDAYIQAQGYDFLDFDGLNRWYRSADSATHRALQ
jgi:FkbM family methyltransferase